MVSMSFFMLLSIVIIITVKTLSDKLLASASSCSSLENSLVLSLGVCFLVFPFWLLFVFSALVVKLMSDIASNCNQQPQGGAD